MLYTEVLKQNKDFQICYHKGKYVVSQNVIIYAKQNRLPYNRLGITTGKKIGNAVCRSRARRIIRQAWRENEIHVPVGMDIVVVARAHITEVNSCVISRWLSKYGIPALHEIYAGTYQQPSKKSGKI